MSEDWRDKLPDWATSDEKEKKWMKALGAGANKLAFNKESNCDSFLEGKFPAPLQPFNNGMLL